MKWIGAILHASHQQPAPQTNNICVCVRVRVRVQGNRTLMNYETWQKIQTADTTRKRMSLHQAHDTG